MFLTMFYVFVYVEKGNYLYFFCLTTKFAGSKIKPVLPCALLFAGIIPIFQFFFFLLNERQKLKNDLL